MLSVGLTGGIGSGKSSVARRLAALGAVVIDADVLAREVVAPGTPGLAQVVARFGREVLDRDGALDRATLAEQVFGDPQALRDLEAIVHPAVRSRAAGLSAVAQAADPDVVVVQDVPLLVENDLAGQFDVVVVVAASEATRLARLVRDRGMTADQAQARIAAQANDAARRAVADVWLDNGGSQQELETAVDGLWARLRAHGAPSTAAAQPRSNGA